MDERKRIPHRLSTGYIYDLAWVWVRTFSGLPASPTTDALRVHDMHPHPSHVHVHVQAALGGRQRAGRRRRLGAGRGEERGEPDGPWRGADGGEGIR